MNTRTRRGIAGTISVVIVGAVIGGAALIGSNMAAAEPTPTPSSAYDPAAIDTFRETVEDAIAEAERVAAEAEAARIAEEQRVAAEAAAAEAARVEAERVAAEQAAADQAAQEQRDAAARQAPAPQAPAAPAPAPAPPAGGDQQAGECREYNDANECTAYYTP